MYYLALTETSPPLSLKPGAEKERFVLVKPMEREFCVGIVDDKIIRPETIGGTWYPALYVPGSEDEKVDVILHLHGGAWVLGSGRKPESGFQGGLLAKSSQGKVFCPQYRLACNPEGQFPAALQDTISSYQYLLNLGISPNRIVLSGDSAGANISLGLLRYISENEGILPWPVAAWLWAPWVDMAFSQNLQKMKENRNFTTECIAVEVLNWGAQVYVPKSMDPSHPYISPVDHPFPCRTPLWAQVGEAEILYDEAVRLVNKMKGVDGNKIELWIEPHAPHDPLSIGNMTGFEQAAEEMSLRAVEFLKEQRMGWSDFHSS